MVGKLFASIMLIWFLILVGLGLRSIIVNLEVLYVLNLMWVVYFFFEYKTVFFIVLGVVVLSITGVEVLYVDMGYFGKFFICLVWFIVVLFFLIFNYFGQGVLLLKNLEVIKNLFFLLVLDWVLILLLIIVVLVMVIVLQVVIFGVFLLMCQVVCLGYLLLMCIIYIFEMELG